MATSPAKFIILAVVTLYILKLTSAFCSIDSVGDPEYPYKYYQTKTLYDTVRGKLTEADRPDDCSPIHIVMLARHGARHPGADEADIFQSFLELAKKLNSTGKAEMCVDDMQKIREWKNWHQPSLDKDLAITGYSEMQGLAERYSELFPELLTGAALDASNYRFISSDSIRAVQSADAFVEKLFANSVKPKPTVEQNNRLIKYYEYCQKYIVEIDDNDTVTEDAEAFLEGPYVTEIADRFALRLGIPRNEVTNDLVNEVRKEGCAEEEWATGNISAWCLAFRKPDLEVFEYAEDIEDYLEKSFAYEVNYRQSCKLKEFMLSALKNASTGDNSTLGHFAFGHSTTIMPILTEMKLIQDGGLLKSNEYPENINRSFRGSLYEPASANILFVLYGCGATNEKKIQIFLNEKLVQMPLDNPSPDGLWDLSEALEYFNYDVPGDCEWDKICSVEEEDGVTVASTTETTTSASQKILTNVRFLLVVVLVSLTLPICDQSL